MSTDDLRELEDALRAALQAEASAITPSERLSAIQQASRIQPVPAARPRPWLVLLSAAATVAVVATVAALALLPGFRSATPPAGSAPATTSMQPSDPVSSTHPLDATPTVQGGAVPVYLVVATTSGPDDYGLSRTFLRLGDTALGVALDAPKDAIIAAALNWVAAHEELGSPTAPSTGLRVHSVLTTADSITITADGLNDLPADSAAVAERARLSLVLTAQAIVGRGDLAVRFVSREGASRVRGAGLDADFHRPSPAALAALASPIWLDRPGWGEVLPTGTPRQFSGLTTRTDTELTWRITRRGEDAPLAQGSARSAVGALQSAFSFTVPALSAGWYVVTVTPADGTGRTEVDFSVR